MSALRKLAKRIIVSAIGRTAPITWRWRKPGSLVVLMYHRVLPAGLPARETEQPGMYVSPETLDLHLAELKRYFELVHLNDWLRRAQQGRALPKLACAISFDDGWRDNYQFAMPILVKHGAPATIFLVSSYIGTKYRFWPNRLIELIVREHSQPGSVNFPTELSRLVAPVLDHAYSRGRIDIEDIDPVIQRALKLKEEDIRALVDAADYASVASDSRDTVNHQEISAMSSTGLIRFGSHSATHFRLHRGAPPERLVAEIVGSRARLQEICNQPVDLFCYPNGVTSKASISLVAKHYTGAVITETGWHSPRKDPFTIPRIRVHEDVSNYREGFLERLSGLL